MKKTKLLSLFTLVIAMMFVACSSKDDYLSALPAQPFALSKVNVGNLITKSQVLEDAQVKGLLKKGINELSGDSRILLREVLENPDKTGLDFSRDVYFVMENFEQQIGQIGLILFAVKDVDALKNMIKTLLADSEFNSNLTLASVENINTIEDRKGNAVAAFDASKFVIAIAEKSNADALEYMKADNKESTRSDKLNDFISLESDVSVFIDYGQIMRFVINSIPEMTEFNIEDFKDASLSMALNFEPGQVVANAHYQGFGKFNKIYDEIIQVPNKDLLSYIPNNSYVVGNAGIKDLAKFIKLLPEIYVNQANKQMDEFNNRIAQMDTLNTQGKNNNIKMKWELLNSLNGGIVVAVTPSIPSANQLEPQFMVVAECKDSKLFDFIEMLMKLDGNQKPEVAKNVYALGLNKKIDWDNHVWGEDFKYIHKGYDYYLGYVDNKIFVMPENFYRNPLNALSNNFATNSLSSKIKDKYAFVVDVPAIINDLEQNIGKERVNDKILLKNFRKIENVTFEFDGTNSEFVVNLADKENNALKQIKDFVISLAIAEAVD